MRNIRTVPQLLFRIFVRPIFPFLQWLGRITGIAKEAKTLEGPYHRQPYVIGFLREGVSAKELEVHLGTQGFFVNRIAYPDPEQVLSMRRLSDEHPDEQYHIRLFENGELRGHFEYTPEDHPLAHLDEALLEKRTAEFTRFIGPLLRS